MHQGRHRRDWLTLQLAEIDVLEGIAFEEYVAQLLQRRGFDTEPTKASCDLGVDIIANCNSQRYAVQVKPYASSVGRRAVSDAVAGQSFYQCDGAMVITN